jgi:hypothetical protein
MAGVVAAMLGLVWAVHVAGLLTFLSGLVAWALMDDTLPGRARTATSIAAGIRSPARSARQP